MVMMKISRAVTKPALMADQSSPKHYKYARVIQSLFGSSKFRDFTTKFLSGAEALRIPTSIFDSMLLPPFGTFTPRISSEKKSSWNKMDSRGIGLALVDEGADEENSHKPSNGNVLLGTQLRVKIPPLSSPFTFCPFESQTSSNAVRIETQNSLVSPTGSQSSELYTEDSSTSRVISTGVLSLSEMELSEEYTCIISHGPNPRTTHIFDDCVVKSHCSLPGRPQSASGNFLSFCYTCKKHLEHSKDIFIYRGEKAFCSHECRCQEMMADTEENSEADINHHS